MKIFVIGCHEAVLGFSLVGVQGRVVSTAAEANNALDEALSNSENGIVLVSEDISALIEARMDHLKLRSTVPLVVEIPGPQGANPNRPTLNDVMLRAIGVKL
jgi:V/A-type H+-transporting ATPase subunit F